MKLLSKVIASSLLTIGLSSGAAAYTIDDSGPDAFYGQGTDAKAVGTGWV